MLVLLLGMDAQSDKARSTCSGPAGRRSQGLLGFFGSVSFM